MSKFPHLFSPIDIAGHTYKNRILSAPMLFGFYALEKGTDQRVYKIFEDRARGGAAEVVVGETPVNLSDAPDIYLPGLEVDYTKTAGPAFHAYKKYADVIKKHGAFALIEIFHAGHAKNPLPLGDRTNPWGPMGLVREDGVTVEAFDGDKMQKVRRDFVTCSQFMKAAGFDGVCIHGGHGFLFTQFLSPSSNRRTDEYGGSLQNRGRFPRHIMQDMRSAMGDGFIIELRINGADLVPGGSTSEDIAEFCSTLDGLVDIIHISSGFKSMGYATHEFTSMYDVHGINVERAAAVKKKTGIPVTVVGGINSPEFAEEIIAQGRVDFVSLGRQMISDPEFVAKAGSGREGQIRRCIRCYHCYPGMPEIPGDEMRVSFAPPMTMKKLLDGVEYCTLNPRANREVELEQVPAPRGSRDVLVVGGGPAGMQAAITASDRGHRVTLLEKNDALGGILQFTDSDAHKVDLRNFKDLLVREVARRDIRLMLGTEASPQFMAEHRADAVILALGATPSVPSIPGIRDALHALDVYSRGARLGKRIIMLGGGLAGCETGLHLAARGHYVTIVEMLDRLASKAYAMGLTATIRQIEKQHNMVARTGMKCIEVSGTSVKAENPQGRVETIEGDTIVYSLGMAARRAETQRLHAAAGTAQVYQVGDCVRAARVYEAVSQGFLAALKII